MPFWDRFTKQVRRLGFVSPMSPWESPPERNTRGFLSAYGEIYSLFGISLRIATAVSEVKWRLYKGSERSERTQISDHPILKLLDFANEFQTGQEIMELLELHMDLAGKAYWFLPKNKLGVPAEIWVLPPHLVKIVPSKEKFIAGYIFDSGGEKIPLGTDEVIRFPMPDPLNLYGGVGFAQAAAVELDSEIYSGKWNRNFFYNSARPDAALEFEGNLTDDQFEKLKEQWQSRHQGLSRAHKIAILQGGIKYRQIQIAQKDMDFLQLRKQTRENLMFAFGMPQSVMGVSENVNRANAEAGDYTFARWLVRPRLIRIKNKLNEQLLPMFPMAKGVELDFDEVVPETLEQKKALSESGVKAGWMTVNEARQLNGFDPIPSGNVFLIPFNLMPTPADKPIKPPPSAEAPAPKTRGFATEEQKEAFWHIYASKAENLEKPFIQTLKDLWEAQQKEALGKLNASTKPDALLFDLDEANAEFLKRLKPLIYETFNIAAGDATDLISPEPAHRGKQELNPEAMEWIDKRALWLVKGINDTTRDSIRGQLTEGIKEGEGVPKLGRRIRDVFTDCNVRRGKVIARTETIAASNEGALNGYKASGVVERVEFYAALDERTCDECMDYHGKVVSIGEAGGVIPVHPDCRCTWLPVI